MLELASIVMLGIFAQWVSWKMKLPAILPLILTGLFFGPVSQFFTENGDKLINPIFNAETQTGLFPEKTFFFFVSLAIGLILFEGGLTLKIKDFGKVGTTIIKLIIYGPLVTLTGASLFAYYIMGINWQISLLFASLIVVTGPTVIAPILRNLPIKRNISAILKWEGILIDPIGALLAVLVFEFIMTGGSNREITVHALTSFGKIVLIGVSFGFTAAHFLNILIKKKLIPQYLLNVFTLALTLSVFVFSDILAGESGLLAVVVMGLVLGNLNVSEIKGILDFKESLSVLLISVLFIVLSAAIDVKDLMLLADYRVLLLLASVIFILRPIVVFLSSGNSVLNFKDKVFISYMGPRGIVAAGIASLFGMRLAGKIENAEYIIPLVFMVVLGTVIINALTARPVAKALNVLEKKSEGFLIAGANSGARLLAKYLKQNGKHTVLADNSEYHIEKAKKEGLTAYKTDLFSDDIFNNIDLLDVGYLLALTPSDDLNRFVIEKYKKIYGENGAFRLVNDGEYGHNDDSLPKQCAFSCYADYNIFAETARDYPKINEIEVNSFEEYDKIISEINKERNSIPVFIKRTDGDIEILPYDNKKVKIEKGDKLVYMGKKID